MTFSRFRPDTASLLIVLVWALYAIPRLVQSLTGVKRRATVGEAMPLTPLAVNLELLFLLLIFGLCAYIVIRGTAEMPTDRRVPLVLMLAPWVYIVIRDLYNDQVPTRGGLLYPLLVVAIWILRPQLKKLATLGYLVVLTALACIALGALLPESGILISSAGSAVAPPKEILPLGILIGIFTDGNNLGQYLVLGLPAVMLIPRRLVRAMGVAVVLFAIVWTSSRSSLAAAAIACIVWTLMSVTPSVLRRLATWCAVAACVGVMMWWPLSGPADDAWTNRGAIWRHSLAAWWNTPWFGSGSNWYSVLPQNVGSLGGFAFHGHNQFVQTIATGGLVFVVLVTAMFVTITWAASQWSARGVFQPVALLVALFASSTLEVSFGFIDRAFLVAVTVLPLMFAMFAPLPERISRYRR
ncbi:O-antigen ligase [Rhodococcus sp. 27YEA15]|uniref:O-antigen ligase family protein n=1 Tax=Rhodococcus sp. 27YEA15 TaxID=3156259 RepID=UPI003C79B049